MLINHYSQNNHTTLQKPHVGKPQRFSFIHFSNDIRKCFLIQIHGHTFYIFHIKHWPLNTSAGISRLKVFGLSSSAFSSAAKARAKTAKATRYFILAVCGEHLTSAEIKKTNVKLCARFFDNTALRLRPTTEFQTEYLRGFIRQTTAGSEWSLQLPQLSHSALLYVVAFIFIIFRLQGCLCCEIFGQKEHRCILQDHFCRLSFLLRLK